MVGEDQEKKAKKIELLELNKWRQFIVVNERRMLKKVLVGAA